MKAILKYPGSKWRIADEIVKRIPEHHSYLEPFFGSGAVFFNKESSAIETINDLDNEIPNLFRCIRDDPEKLAARVTLTPYSRYEYENAYGGVPADEYDQAMQFLIRCWQGYGYRVNGKVGWKNDVQGRESMYEELVQSPGQYLESGRTTKMRSDRKPTGIEAHTKI